MDLSRKLEIVVLLMTQARLYKASASVALVQINGSKSLNLTLVIFLLENSRSRMELQVNVGRVVGGTSRCVAW